VIGDRLLVMAHAKDRGIQFPALCLSCGLYETTEGTEAFMRHDCETIKHMNLAQIEANERAHFEECHRRMGHGREDQ
jgi:hypothetical protein